MPWFWVHNGGGGNERVKLYAGCHEEAVAVMRERWRAFGIRAHAIVAVKADERKGAGHGGDVE